MNDERQREADWLARRIVEAARLNRDHVEQSDGMIERARANPGHVYDQWGREMDPVEVEDAHVALKRTTAAVRGHRCEGCDSIVRGAVRCAVGIRLGEEHQAAIKRMREAVLK